MLVFLDDSGDPGFKLDRGSSSHLVMAACAFADHRDVERAAEAIHAYRAQIGWLDFREFHFTKCSRDVRLGFLNAVAGHDFFVRAVVIDKSRLISTHRRSRPGELHNYAIRALLTHSNGAIADAKIKIDGRDTKTFKLKNAAYFRRVVNDERPGTISEISTADSSRNVMIQLADMVAGAIHRSYNADKVDAKLYRAVLQRRLRDSRSSVWEFR
jgi:hypothetical protein